MSSNGLDQNLAKEITFQHSDEWGIDTGRCLAILEDSEAQREDLRRTFENEGFKVVIPTTREECLALAQDGCLTFILDVDMGGRLRKVEGLATLEDLKRIRQDTFCAVVTGNSSHRTLALKFGADCFLDKTFKGLQELSEKLNEAYLLRRLPVDGRPLTLRTVGELLRRENQQMPSDQETRISAEESLAFDRRFEELAKEISKAVGFIDPLVKSGNFRRAAQEMILVEPTLRELTDCAEKLGDGFGIGIQSLRNAAKNVSHLTLEMWNSWHAALLQVLSTPPISWDSASELARKLDEDGFNIDPPNWHMVSDILSELHDSEHPVAQPEAK